ncbi:MAG: FAD-dependent oxidoreductase [Jatrophihabitantaceae bacterium]|nr:FAD-dependent oxidoreductase [Jatrophihabitantaceae bacterium]
MPPHVPDSAIPDAADVVVVGAGLAGLAAAVHLHRAGRDVLLLEASDGVGGRVRTDRVDGFAIDRGFQLINPAYPELLRLDGLGVLDLAAMDLRGFEPGLLILTLDGESIVADPRRDLRRLGASLRAPGTLRAKAAFAAWVAQVGFGPAAAIRRGADRPLAETLRRRGVSGDLLEQVVRPFLAGVLGDDGLEDSTRVASMLVRSFVRGTPSLPAAGVQALPDQLAAALPSGATRLNAPVESVAATSVRLADGTSIAAAAVVLAVDPETAARLGGLPAPRMRGLTTFYHRADWRLGIEHPRLLRVDGARRGPIVNSAVMSAAAPTYAPAGQALIATTVLGADGSAEMLRDVTTQLALLYGSAASEWELLTVRPIPGALPMAAAGTPMRKSIAVNGLVIAGDHRDTPSIQGALVSGRRAAEAVLASA